MEDKKILDEFDPAASLASLIETRKKLQHISSAIGGKASEKALGEVAGSLGVKLDQSLILDASKADSNRKIADKLAQKVLA